MLTFDEADHSFHVPKRSGRTDADVLEALVDSLVNWMRRPSLR